MRLFSLPTWALMGLLAASPVLSFTCVSHPQTKASTALFAKKKKLPEIQSAAALSFVTASYLMANAVSVAPAMAFDNVDFGAASSNSMLIAARSGGRMGGRASSGFRGGGYGGGYSRGGGYGGGYRSSTTIIRPMVAPMPMVSPFGYGYNPLGGFGMGYGLGSMNSLGNEARDYRQEAEIQKSQAELEQAKAHEAELEQRIKALEEQKK